jgi:hypothetical protein
VAPGTAKALLLLIVFLVAVVAGLITGIVRFQEHRTLPDAFLYGSGAFVAVSGLLLSALGAVHAFPE